MNWYSICKIRSANTPNTKLRTLRSLPSNGMTQEDIRMLWVVDRFWSKCWNVATSSNHWPRWPDDWHCWPSLTMHYGKWFCLFWAQLERPDFATPPMFLSLDQSRFNGQISSLFFLSLTNRLSIFLNAATCRKPNITGTSLDSRIWQWWLEILGNDLVIVFTIFIFLKFHNKLFHLYSHTLKFSL